MQKCVFVPDRLGNFHFVLRSGFIWNVEEDFKTVPETWIPAHGVQHHNGHPVPDEHGHIPGSLNFLFVTFLIMVKLMSTLDGLMCTS